MKVNIKDIARIAGVSVSTVSLALNKKPGVSEKTRIRVQSVAEKLNYIPSNVARSLVTKKTRSIGLIVSDIAEAFFGTLARIIQDSVNEENYSLILCNSDERSDKERDCLDFLVEKAVDGIIMTPSDSENRSNIEKVESVAIPIVFVDSYLKNTKISFVGVDNERAGYTATNHLIKLGHQRIACITGPARFSSSDERILGYRRALQAAEIVFDDLLVKHTDWAVEGGYQATRELLSLRDRPTAIFVTGDTCAIGVFKALDNEELSVPDDVAIVSFDDMKFAPFLKVPLTSVKQPLKELGQSAVKLLFERLGADGYKGYKKVILKTELLIRESCGYRRKYATL
jgi:LacI family transcriptional regulator